MQTMASKMTTISSSKRRKSRHHDIASCLVDLPIGILEHTASFLAAPSRALFSVALSTNENNTPSGNYSSIAGSNWDTLDFGEIEKELATKLSDDDISNILQHIDAVNNVKRLRLTNCIQISGVCLEPLRGSAIIEQIDLSLVGDGESPVLDPEPPISCDAVLPILDSIIASDRCAIKHLQFPYKWRRDRSTESEFHAFIEQYNEMREERDTISCSNCNQNLPLDGRHWIGMQGGLHHTSFLHNYTCYQCTKHYCDGCTDDEGGLILQYCELCQRDYCKGCEKFGFCELCENDFCEYCSKFVECNECHKNICSGCMEDDCYACSYCDVAYCSSCNKMELCEQCRKRCCNPCRLRLYQEGGSEHCINCIKLLPHEAALVDQSRRLQQEVEQLKNEVRGLKDANKELQDENKELRGDNKSMAG